MEKFKVRDKVEIIKDFYVNDDNGKPFNTNGSSGVISGFLENDSIDIIVNYGLNNKFYVNVSSEYIKLFEPKFKINDIVKVIENLDINKNLLATVSKVTESLVYVNLNKYVGNSASFVYRPSEIELIERDGKKVDIKEEKDFNPEPTPPENISVQDEYVCMYIAIPFLILITSILIFIIMGLIKLITLI